MNNTEAINNTPNNVRGRGRGRENGRGGIRGCGRHAGTFVFVDPTVQHSTTPVNNSNAQAEKNNADVEDDNGPSRPYKLWPEVAICILLEIMAGTYNHLLRRGDIALKQFIWVHSAALFKEKMAEYATTDAIREFIANVTHLSMQRKLKDKKGIFTGAGETGVGGTVPDVPHYEEIAKITQDNPSIQLDVIYESVNMEENGIRSYRRSNVADLMDAIGSMVPKLHQLMIRKSLADRYPAEDSVDPEGSSVPSSSTAPAPAPPSTPSSAPPTSTPATEAPTPTPTSASAVPPASTGATPPPRYTFAPPPPPYSSASPLPPPTSAPPPPRSTHTLRNNRTSGEQSSSTIDPIEDARQLPEERMAHARQLGVEMMNRMAAVQREEREQRIRYLDSMLQRVSRNRQTALEDMQTRRLQESRERYRLLEESRSRREADLEEDKRKRISDMETIMNRFAAIRRGDSDINLGSSSTDNNN
ncbi:uncharacterized protein EV154DRAFT_568880 [Mucor mucedo]|uniref:uncharacterized protein n=1 Tax=Mucor mucedo TaxID=29922 RepID=UPI00221EA387|nr:uncharacterized protein EV154DRAFT_568880 [Mucor mucedo]KAI7878540.1 hypothetical protein EV154DRAFT_568880 [Mucor mucedo]